MSWLFSQVTLAIGLLSNITHFSGIMFQVIYSMKRKNRITVDVLAAGGRYDTLLTRFRKPGSSAASPTQAAVGVSIAYDKVHWREVLLAMFELNCSLSNYS